MLDGEGHPRFIWRTTEVTIKPLSEADEAFGWDEGEGDRTRKWWLDAHRRYFARQASQEGVRAKRRDPHPVRALRDRVAAPYSGCDSIPVDPKRGKEGTTMGKLEGKVAVVTGAASGLGRVWV